MGTAAAGHGPNGGAAYLTDEEILGIHTEGDGSSRMPDTAKGGIPTPTGSGEESQSNRAAENEPGGHAEIPRSARDDNQEVATEPLAAVRSTAEAVRPLPEWLKPLLGDPKIGREAHALWEQHQAYQEAFPTVAEARAVKELFPGGVQDARQLLARAEAVAELDDAYYSADPRAHARLAANLLGENPRVFQSMLSQAARVLAERDPGGFRDLVEQAQLWAGARDARAPAQATEAEPASLARERAELARQREDLQREQQEFRAAQYAGFQQAAHEHVVQQVRRGIEQMLEGALPADVSDGARKRIADDIYNEVHATLQADRGLTRQVAGILREWRFDEATQKQVANLVFGRAKALLPGVAKRVVNDWTTSVLGANRQKFSKQQAAASRVDIVGGGASEPLGHRVLHPGDVDYTRMSDEEILNL